MASSPTYRTFRQRLFPAKEESEGEEVTLPWCVLLEVWIRTEKKKNPNHVFGNIYESKLKHEKL